MTKRDRGDDRERSAKPVRQDKEPAPGDEFGPSHPRWREPTEREAEHTSAEGFESGAFAGRSAPRQKGRDNADTND